ncbi:MAG: NosD domain-containing protein [Isosphaeraceae bacterium]
MMIHGASAFNNRVLGNWIGPNARGLGGAGNGVGVYVTDARGNAIGQAGGGNVISGNTGVGVYLLGGGSAGSSTPGNTVAANTIGLDPTGTKPLPNQTGVYLGVSTGNTIGGAKAADGNVISANLEVGVYVVGPTPGRTS